MEFIWLNDNGTTFTFIGTHQIINYPTQISFQMTTASGNELYSVRLGFDENNTHYNTYKLEVQVIIQDQEDLVREIQFGEHKYKTINHAYQQRDEINTITIPQRENNSQSGALQWMQVTDGTSPSR